MNRIQFGTDGWRGIMASQFTVANVAKATSATATWLMRKYSNPEVDKLLDEASVIYDQQKRKELYYKAVRIITMDAPYVFIVYVPEWAAMKPEVHGFKWIPDLIPRYSFLWKGN